MPHVDWYVEGTEFGNCNCDYGCPCQFEALPTGGSCRGFEVVHIDKGHFGDVRLDGLNVALLYAWPGPIFEGNGEMQAVIDDRATEAQRAALVTILHGGETNDEATHWWVYHAMSSKVHPPISASIAFDVDIPARTAAVTIPGVLDATGEPIKSLATGLPHRVRISIPDGIEFEVAEIGSGSTQARGVIRLDLKDSSAQFNRLRHSGTGVVH